MCSRSSASASMRSPRAPITRSASRTSRSPWPSTTSSSLPGCCAGSRPCRTSSWRAASNSAPRPGEQCQARRDSAVDRIDRALVHRQCRLVDRFGERRMGVDRALQVLAARGVLHGEHRFGDQLAGERSDDVYTENLIVIAGRHDLRKALRLLEGAGATAGEEGESSGLVGAPACLHLLLVETDPGDLRRRVDDERDDLVVHLAEAAGDEVGHHHAFLLALVSEHRAAHAVTDGPDVLDTGTAVLVDLDEAALIELHSRLRSKEVLGVGAPADCNHEPIDSNALLSLRIAVGDLHLIARHRRAIHLGAGADVESLLLEVTQRLTRQLLIRKGEKIGQRFDDHDLRAEAAPDTTQLQADDTAADYAEALWHRLEFERAPGVDDVWWLEVCRA